MKHRKLERARHFLDKGLIEPLVWGRTHCSGDPTIGKFTYATLDCGSDKVECVSADAIPHSTLAKFTLNGDQSLHFYDIRLVDEYNLPMLIVAKGGTRGGCSTTKCLIDLNSACLKELSVFRANGSWAMASRARAPARRLVIQSTVAARHIICRILATPQPTHCTSSTHAHATTTMSTMTRPVRSHVPPRTTSSSSTHCLTRVLENCSSGPRVS
ncbi:Pathogenesis-related thaumatin superfamily protein [Abeliophyllum distichum]|uniref:Pathogenesis-related thaumatin superfamily protein n=1 Tax=Abeliophyllum distichum TaxID=126358 RepID=A0ABD1RV02_9LAMI